MYQFAHTQIEVQEELLDVELLGQWESIFVVSLGIAKWASTENVSIYASTRNVCDYTLTNTKCVGFFFLILKKDLFL